MGKYFTISELCCSGVAALRGIDNVPSPGAAEALNRLIDNLLDPLREIWGAAITVNSGYRCQLLNAAVGGAVASQHMLGEAADITAGVPVLNRRLFDMIIASGLDFDQLIDEKGYAWLHVSWGMSNRRQVLHL